MDITTSSIPLAEFREMLRLLERRENVMKKLGYAGKLPIFERGDRVGFFYGPGDDDYSFGTLIDDNQNTAYILGDDGHTYKVSPFSLFALK